MKIFSTFRCKLCSVMLLLGVSIFLVPVAQATTVSFTEIVNDGGPNLSEQLSVDVTNLGSNNVGFRFFNGRDGETTVDSIIGGIFFDIGSSNVLDIVYSATNSSDGVLFTATRGTPNLPEGEQLEPEFTDDAGFKFGHDNDIAQGNGTGVNDANAGTAEFAGFVASLGSGFSFNRLISNIISGDFRIGLHVISIEGEGSDAGSDSYISTVPVPAAAWLFGSALFGIVVPGVRRRKKCRQLPTRNDTN